MSEAGEPLRGVVFDLDGTLYDKRALEWFMVRSMPLGLLRLLQVHAGAHRPRGDRLRERRGDRTRDARAWRVMPASSSAGRRWIRERYEPAVLRGLREAAALYPGVPELLGRLRAAGLRLGLVSDYRGVPDRLAALGLAAEDFDFVLVTEELGAMKPAPRMAEATLAGMQLPGAAMVMVGDRAFADERFAAAAGMRFLGVRPRGPADATWMPWAAVQARLLALSGA
jgi:HAD superfamily hydrolase (TIGR01549 family)